MSVTTLSAHVPAAAAGAVPEDSTPKKVDPPVPAHSPVTAAAYLLAGHGTMQVLRFGANVLLARMLVPEIFGIMALVNLLIQGLHMLSDVGVWVCVMQSKRGDDKIFLQTAWTLQVVRGFLLWAVTPLLGLLGAYIYGEPVLLLLLPVAGLTSAIDGFRSTALFTMNRRLAPGRPILIEFIAYSSTTVLTVAAVWCFPTVWVLVGAALLASSLQTGLTYVLLPPGEHRFRWEKEAGRELLHFGRWIFVSTFCSFLANQADRLLLGAVTSVAALGLYHIAAMFASVPTFLAGCFAGSLLLPYYSRLRDAGTDPARGFSRVHRLGSAVAWVLTALLGVAGPTVIGLLYRGPYEEAAFMLRILVFNTWLQMLQTIGGALVLAHGGARSSALINLGKLVALPPLALVGLHFGGMIGLLWAFVAAEFLRYVLTLVQMLRLGFNPIRQDLSLSVLLLLASLAGFVLGPLAGAQGGVVLRLLVEAGIVGAAGAGLLLDSWVRHRSLEAALSSPGRVSNAPCVP